jgi:integral membrane protein (TIGR01906 family)
MRITAYPSPRLLAILSILLTLLVPALLVLISVRVVMTDTYLKIEYAKPDFPEDSYGFTLQDRLHYAPFALNYLLGSADISYLGNLTFADGAPLYNNRELQHMVDVKKVFQFAINVLIVGLIVFVLMFGFMLRTLEGRNALRRGLIGGGLLTLALLAGLVIFLLLNWDTFFTDFHNLFFASGTWVFDYSDSLIRLFPIQFWQDTSLTIGSLSAIFAVLLIVISWYWARRERVVNV